MLKQEYALTQNVKSRVTRKNVLDALEKITNHLRQFKETPPNGLVVFAGNVSNIEGQSDIKLWSIEPPEELTIKMYWCDQVFALDPLKEMVREKEIYGIIVLDTAGTDIGLLVGKKVVLEKHVDSLVPGKTTKGGWCVSSDSFTAMSSGIIKMKNVKKSKNPILAYDFNNKQLVFTGLNAIKKRKATNAYKITTTKPMFWLEVTPEHNIFVVENGEISVKSAEEIKPGDNLLGLTRMPHRGKEFKFGIKKLFNYKITPEGIKLLKQKRKELGLYQRYVGECIGLTQTAISKLELNKINLSQKNLTKLLKLYKINHLTFFKKYIEKIPSFKFPNKTNPKFCQILGYMLGDGTLDGNRIILYDEDKQLLRYYEKLIKKQFDIDASLKSRRNYYELKVYSVYITEILHKFFREIFVYSNRREIPELITSLPLSQISSFIKGLFDAEGYVDNSNNSVAITMSSKDVINSLQMLLLKFGIISSISSRIHGFSRKTKYRLIITDPRSIFNFANFIGFSSITKKNKLRKIIETLQFSGSLNLDKTEIMPIQVVKKESVKPKNYYYDISVPKYNNFIVNGIIVHNSQQRYARIREEAKLDHLKKSGEIASEIFKQYKDLKGIIIGGPGPLKEKFFEGEFIDYTLRKKILGVVDTSYTGFQGLEEAVNRGEDLIKEAAAVKEKQLMQTFFTHLQKDDGLAVYKMEDIIKALEFGAIDILLISESFDWVKMKLSCQCGFKTEKAGKPLTEFKCPNCGSTLTVTEKKELGEILLERVKEMGGSVQIISIDSREGISLKEIGGIGAILRFKLQ